MDLSEHYFKRIKLLYKVAFILHFRGEDPKNLSKYYNYYEDMIFLYGIPHGESDIMGLW